MTHVENSSQATSYRVLSTGSRAEPFSTTGNSQLATRMPNSSGHRPDLPNDGLEQAFQRFGSLWGPSYVLPLVNVSRFKRQKNNLPLGYDPGNFGGTGGLGRRKICRGLLGLLGTGKAYLPQSFCRRPDRGVRSALCCANHQS